MQNLFKNLTLAPARLLAIVRHVVVVVCAVARILLLFLPPLPRLLGRRLAVLRASGRLALAPNRLALHILRLLARPASSVENQHTGCYPFIK